RAIGSKRSKEKIAALRAKLFTGMAANGIDEATGEAIYRKIEAFAGFGFAESHSLAFAKLVYASSWLKLHYPAAFLAGLLRSQPMGFWSAQTLVKDALRHGVETLRPDVVHSGVAAALEPHGARRPGADACLEREQPPVPKVATESLAVRDRHRRDAGFAVRMGLASVTGVGEAAAERIVAARAASP